MSTNTQAIMQSAERKRLPCTQARKLGLAWQLSLSTRGVALCLIAGLLVAYFGGPKAPAPAIAINDSMNRGKEGEGAFVLLVRTLDPVRALPATLDHYASCMDVNGAANITAIRVVQAGPDSWPVGLGWSLEEAGRALVSRRIMPDDQGCSKLRRVAEGRLRASSSPLWSLVLAESHGVSDQRGEIEGALLVNDDIWIECKQLSSVFREWKQHRGRRIVGTVARSHEMVASETLESGGLVYKYVPNRRPDGGFSMIALDGALLHASYLLGRLPIPVSASSQSHLEASICGEIALNMHATLQTGLPPVYVAGMFVRVLNGNDTAAKTYTEQLTRAGDACLMHMSDHYGGKIPLLWSESSILDIVPSQMPRNTPSLSAPLGGDNAASTPDSLLVQAEGDPTTRGLAYQPFLGRPSGMQLYDDARAAVSAVIVMENGPNDVALAVRFLRARYPFIQEVVVWNNANETMNHHMFPYDLAVRYVLASYDHGAFGKYLGCMVARHEICYFQHERARPDHLRALYATFVSRPDLVATSAEASAALKWKQRLHFAGTGPGRSSGYADLSGGAFVHKAEVRRFVSMVKADDATWVAEAEAAMGNTLTPAPAPDTGTQGHSQHTRYRGSSNDPKVADLDFVFSLAKPPLVLVLAREPVLDNRPPRPHHSHNATVASLRWAASMHKGQSDVSSATIGTSAASSATGRGEDIDNAPTYHRAPCSNDACVFMTSVDAWPFPRIFDSDGDNLAASVSNADEETSRRSSLDAVSYYRAVDGDLGTVWSPPPGDQLASAFVGIELTRDDARFAGVELWIMEPAGAPESPTPRLQFMHVGQAAYRFADECTVSKRRSSTLGLLRFTYTCPALAVRRLRVVADQGSLHVAELQVIPLIRTKHVANQPTRSHSSLGSDSRVGIGQVQAHPQRTEGPPLLPIKVAYVIHDDLSAKPFQATTLALLEEACELGVLHPGRVTLVYAGPSRGVSIDVIAEHFSVVGSSRSLHDCILFESLPWKRHKADNAAAAVATEPASVAHDLATRRREFHRWWNARPWEFSVVFYDPVGTPLLPVLREKGAAAKSHACVFGARVYKASALDDEAMTLADAALFASKDLFWTAARQAVDWRQDRRVMYPLRTLDQVPDYVLEPIIPVVEEVLALVTGATRADELSMFYTHALPVLQDKATVKLINLTALAHKGIQIEGMAADVDVPLDVLVRTPRWRTLADLIYYASVYPARLIWILDSSAGASYYASATWAQGARFVASPGAVPHYESRIVSWNSTCQWTDEGFAIKARELVRGEFILSSSFKQQLLTPNTGGGQIENEFIIEEWPMRREMHPFVNTASNVSRYVSELVLQSRQL